MLVLISAILYRMGGAKGYNTKFRDIGCALICTYAIGCWEWYGLLSGVLLFAALTSYWSWVNPLIKQPKDTKFWWNWALVGMGYGLALLPITIWGDLEMTKVCYRIGLLTILTAAWSCLINNDELEELGRGALIVLTLEVL